MRVNLGGSPCVVGVVVELKLGHSGESLKSEGLLFKYNKNSVI